MSKKKDEAASVELGVGGGPKVGEKQGTVEDGKAAGLEKDEAVVEGAVTDASEAGASDIGGDVEVKAEVVEIRPDPEPSRLGYAIGTVLKALLCALCLCVAGVLAFDVAYAALLQVESHLGASDQTVRMLALGCSLTGALTGFASHCLPRVWSFLSVRSAGGGKGVAARVGVCAAFFALAVIVVAVSVGVSAPLASVVSSKMLETSSAAVPVVTACAVVGGGLSWIGMLAAALLCSAGGSISARIGK